jgi:hypothetical protein
MLSFHLEFRIVFCHMNAVKEFAANLQGRFVIRGRLACCPKTGATARPAPKTANRAIRFSFPCIMCSPIFESPFLFSSLDDLVESAEGV